jgi:LytR cell envelope-related transcriptional attenuator
MDIRRTRRRRASAPSGRQGGKPRRRIKTRLRFRDAAIQFLIVLFLAVDLVLAFFFVRRCAGSKPRPVDSRLEAAKPPVAEAPPPRRSVAPSDVLRIEVLNGCGVPRIADRFTDYLRKRGFDVVRSGNYDAFGVTKTLVIDRKGDLSNAVRVAKALGLSRERALQEPNDAFTVDATVIVGQDFRQLSSWKKMEKDRGF